MHLGTGSVIDRAPAARLRPVFVMLYALLLTELAAAVALRPAVAAALIPAAIVVGWAQYTSG